MFVPCMSHISQPVFGAPDDKVAYRKAVLCCKSIYAQFNVFKPCACYVHLTCIHVQCCLAGWCLLMSEYINNYIQAFHVELRAATDADDLRNKSIKLARSCYGSLPYILAYAASGYHCKLHLMTTDGEVRASRLLHLLQANQVSAACHVCRISYSLEE